ncbi:MAG: hypothetical protein COV72_09050, partial [Candidatus Omnitrophica bacterium CG11_big_fil_rev_8_21_14_0_20_42_13]
MFRLPQEVKKDLEGYRSSLEQRLDGKINEARFKGIRVPWGIYSHRGGKIFMSRLRIPAGRINADGLAAIASVSKKYSDGILHITTRQDIQLHNVKLEDTIKIMDELKGYDISPRGGGGNTVRNIIACPYSGLCKDELFDVSASAVSLSEHLLRQSNSFTLPRKFKICFSACPKDCAGVAVNDLGFLAQFKDNIRGFKVFVGGGMGAHPLIGSLLEEFIPENEIGYAAQAVKNLFNANGDRRNKHHNRLRFLIQDMGMDKFKELYRDEIARLRKDEHIVLRSIERKENPALNQGIEQADGEEYQEFLKYNVCAQKQDGYSFISLRIPRGDISAEQIHGLAGLAKDFSGIEFRTTNNQDISICWVKNNDVYRIFKKLKNILSDFLYAGTLLDVVACKGAVTCNLGLCNSPALSKAIEDRVGRDFIGSNVFKKLEIKLNGCPNSCGQHPVGKISFCGLVKRVDNRAVPFYKLFLGGRRWAENSKLAKEVGIIPAKSIPDFLEKFLRKMEETLNEESDIDNFLISRAVPIAVDILKTCSYVPPYEENSDFYVDWGRTEEFSLAGIGPGECGAGVIDMIEADLASAGIAIKEAEDNNFSILKIKEALFNSVRALLVVKGREPKNREEAVKDFIEKFINEEIVSEEYKGLQAVWDSLSAESSPDARKEKLAYVRKLY